MTLFDFTRVPKSGLLLAATLLLTAPAALAQTTPAAPTAPAASAPAPVSAGQRKAAESLLEVMQSEKTTDQAINQMLTMQVEQNPNLKKVEPEMRAFMAKYMSWSSLKEEMVQLYAREFSEKELKELTKFYQSTTGQKFVSKQNMLLQSSMLLGQRRVQENLPELQRMIEEKMKGQE
ncbi:DUF2059 domain-containing protein [Hymenobacter sp. J193]|uniref:DUF2059 domain-containing protein n=1 Tax=Hymenobacter sp. J193 TaxID=2898429 RepID=UPI00215137FF|nr:DUF2059 domain-containing protein [Hymenobacter sp. J193]MCR5889077.1 DUF2059 domain-containing protein [Hymenobacter sp. J193]